MKFETAHIANDATSRFFIIMDEVDEVLQLMMDFAIAKSVVEYIHNVVGARMLFCNALSMRCELEDQLNKLSCHTNEGLGNGKVNKFSS